MEVKNQKLQPQEKIEYSKPQLTDFSYDNFVVLAEESSCEGPYDYTTDCYKSNSRFE